MKNTKHHTVGTVLNSNDKMKKTKHHTVGTIPNSNDKMKNTKHHTVGTVLNSNDKMKKTKRIVPTVWCFVFFILSLEFGIVPTVWCFVFFILLQCMYMYILLSFFSWNEIKNKILLSCFIWGTHWSERECKCKINKRQGIYRILGWQKQRPITRISQNMTNTISPSQRHENYSNFTASYPKMQVPFDIFRRRLPKCFCHPNIL
jgi:hypothetical protein